VVVRWHILVRVLGLPFKLIDAIRLGFIGLFFCVFTIGVAGGDTMRAIYVCRQSPGRKTEVIASVIFDRLIGLLTMVGIAALAFSQLNIEQFSISPARRRSFRSSNGRGNGCLCCSPFPAWESLSAR